MPNPCRASGHKAPMHRFPSSKRQQKWRTNNLGGRGAGWPLLWVWLMLHRSKPQRIWPNLFRCLYRAGPVVSPRFTQFLTLVSILRSCTDHAADIHADDLPSDTEAGLQLLAQQFPLPGPPVMLVSQLYTIVPDRTAVDRNLASSSFLFVLLLSCVFAAISACQRTFP